MQSHIFAEKSNTTAESHSRSVKEYYQGLFSIVAGIYDEFSNVSDATLHVLSEEYGSVNGGQSMATVHENIQTPVGYDKMTDQAKSEMLNAATDADMIVILLSTDVFEDTVAEIWNDLVSVAKPESIWCLGAARSSLDNLDFEELEAKNCTLLTYQRVGVARIGSETRDELIEKVKQKAAQ